MRLLYYFLFSPNNQELSNKYMRQILIYGYNLPEAMITTSIYIEPYLAEYIRGKYNNGCEGSLRIPDHTDLYHMVWALMSRRQKNQSPVDAGNLTFILPERRVGKDPKVYNFLSPASARMIEKEIRRMFNRELHTVMDENDLNGHDLNNLEVVLHFMHSYCIESVSEDALLKNFYRWRENMRKRKVRRKYEKRS